MATASVRAPLIGLRTELAGRHQADVLSGQTRLQRSASAIGRTVRDPHLTSRSPDSCRDFSARKLPCHGMAASGESPSGRSRPKAVLSTCRKRPRQVASKQPLPAQHLACRKRQRSPVPSAMKRNRRVLHRRSCLSLLRAQPSRPHRIADNPANYTPSQPPARFVLHRTPPQVSIALIEVSIKRGYLQCGQDATFALVAQFAITRTLLQEIRTTGCHVRF